MNAYISWEVHKQLSDKLLRANARVAELEDTGCTLRARLVEVEAELAKARKERDAFAKEAGTAWNICEERRQEAIGYFAELAKAREDIRAIEIG